LFNAQTDPCWETSSEILDLFVHFRGGVAAVQEKEHLQVTAEGVFVLVATGNARMEDTLSVQAKVILVMGDEDAVFVQGKG
jgi:hypothetical protein